MSIKYDDYGNAYRIANIEEGECLAYAQFVDEDGEASDGELHMVQESVLHAKPPRRKIDSQITELRETLKDLRQQIRTQKEELQSFESDSKDRIEKLKQHKSLQRLDDFIAGRITHYVSISYGPPTIFSFEDTKTDDDYKRDRLKLLTLFGRTDGNLEWGLNKYSDGSGSSSTVYPCTSHSEAIKIASELFAEHAIKALNPNERTSFSKDWAARALKYDIAIGSDYLVSLERQAEAAKNKQIDDLELKIKTLQGESI